MLWYWPRSSLWLGHLSAQLPGVLTTCNSQLSASQDIPCLGSCLTQGRAPSPGLAFIQRLLILGFLPWFRTTLRSHLSSGEVLLAKLCLPGGSSTSLPSSSFHPPTPTHLRGNPGIPFNKLSACKSLLQSPFSGRTNLREWASRILIMTYLL